MPQQNQTAATPQDLQRDVLGIMAIVPLACLIEEEDKSVTIKTFNIEGDAASLLIQELRKAESAKQAQWKRDRELFTARRDRFSDGKPIDLFVS